MTTAMPTITDVYRARRRISPLIAPTPLRPAFTLARKLGQDVYLKFETMLPTRAFKLRGALNCLIANRERSQVDGVITASTGNHGRAVAYAARHFQLPATVCLSELVPTNKRAALEALGATLDVGGKSQDEAMARCLDRARSDDLLYVSPFDDPLIIAGQGTIAVEILETLPDVVTLVVPLSGGGLVAGIAMVAKAMNPGVRIVAVSSERGPAMLASLLAGKPVEVPEEPSIADSLGGGIGLDNRWTLELIRRYVDEVRTVSDEQCAAAIRYGFETEGLVLEGAAAAGIATLLDAEQPALEGPVVAFVTGDNVDVQTFLSITAGDWRPTPRPSAVRSYPKRTVLHD